MAAAVPSTREAPVLSTAEPTRAAALVVVAIGVVLRCIQYAGSGALWMDELALSRNVVDRGWRELIVEPLGIGQVAPAGFVLAQKALVTSLGSDDDLVLRAVPFAASVVSLILFWRLADRWLSGIGSVVAVTLFATAMPLLFFATQAKQYSTDVLASIAIVLCGAVLDVPRPTRRALVICAVVGATLAWLSYPALLVLGATGIVVLIRAVWSPEQRRDVWALAGVVAIWALSALVSLLVAIPSVSPDVRFGMLTFWSRGFPPETTNPLAVTRWLLSQIESLVGAFGTASLRYPAPVVYGALGLLGALALLWRRQLPGQIAVTVGMAALAAAVARQYPLAERLALYLIPLVLLLMAAGVEAIQTWLAPRSRRLAHLAPALVVPCLWPLATAPPPYQLENVHPAMGHLQRHRQPTDRIYVYYGAMLAFDFYGARYGFTNDAYVAGRCHRPDSRAYLEEIDTLRGAPRVWVFFAHAVPRYHDRDDLLDYLDTIGHRVERVASGSEEHPPDVELYLYDLSDPTPLAHADAARHRVRGPDMPVPPCPPPITRRRSAR